MKRSNVSADIETTVELDGLTYDVYVAAEGKGYYDPGCCSGPVENCYPPEGEMEVLSVKAEISVESQLEHRAVTDPAEIKRVLDALGEDAVEEALWASYRNRQDDYEEDWRE